VTTFLDDHLLRDWMARFDDRLVRAVGDDDVATTNLWYARLCKSAARAGGGALLAGWRQQERSILVSTLVALPDDVKVVPMRDLAWQMAELAAAHRGLSTLAAEAVAAARATDGRLLVSARDDGPGLRRCCRVVGIPYRTLAR